MVSRLFAGSMAGFESAVRALNEMFEVNKNEGRGILLVDAANAFNFSNRIAALCNVRIL